MTSNLVLELLELFIDGEIVSAEGSGQVSANGLIAGMCGQGSVRNGPLLAKSRLPFAHRRIINPITEVRKNWYKLYIHTVIPGYNEHEETRQNFLLIEVTRIENMFKKNVCTTLLYYPYTYSPLCILSFQNVSLLKYMFVHITKICILWIKFIIVD